MTRNISELKVILFLFLEIFAPPLLPFNVLYVLLLISLLYLLTERKNVLRSIKLNSDVALYCLWGFWITIVVLFSVMFSEDSLLGNRITVLYQVLFLIPAQIICSKYIHSKNASAEFETIIDFVCGAGVLQSVCVLLAFINPGVRSFFVDLMVNFGGKTVYTEELLSYRSYGFADTLLDTFGYGMGLLAGFIILKEKMTIKDIVRCGLFLIAIVLNSRTGLVVFAISILVKLMFFLKNKKMKMSSKIILIPAIVISVLYILYARGFFKTKTFLWISGGFESVWNYFNNVESGYKLGSMKNSMFNESFWRLPDNWFNILFGTGHSCYGARDILGFASDVGYINYIWICGLLGTVCILLLIVRIAGQRIKSSDNQYYKMVICFVLLAFLMMQIKTNVLSHTAGTFISIVLISYNPLIGKNEVSNEK